MSTASQKRALKTYRSRLSERGMRRFEVVGLDQDRALIRSLAKRLSEDGQQSGRIRADIQRTIADSTPKNGGIYEALRRSPLVGSGVRFTRSRTTGRKIDL